MRLTLIALLTCILAAAQTADDLNFTSRINELRELPRALSNYMSAEARKHLSQRPNLSSAADVQARARQVREQILKNIGGLPEATPLNARTVGVIDRPAYRIEKVIFESRPNFFVTASLYLPKQGAGPFPAILFPLGHESGAKAHEAWQYALGSFASKGFVALAWDPVGQGERLQFYDPHTRRSRMVQSTREHTMLGAQTLLVGESVARYTIHDGLRALDYLASRREVDPKRIGITGNSGGGTHTAYLGAIDDRLQVAAPSCYITSWDKLMTILGPQDAEQNLPPWINLGFDFPDFIHAFQLKPYLVLSAIRDFFPIGGARASFAEARRVYDSAGVANKISMVEADDGHGYTLPRRLAAYQWFSKWLKGADDDGVEPDIQLASETELQCTPTGQVSTSFEGESVHSLNRKRAQQLRGKSADVIAAARKLSGYHHRPGTPKVTAYGIVHKDGYRLEKFTYESEPGILIPAVLAIPAKPSGTALIYADGSGKSAAASRLPEWLKQGITVLAVDLRGMGENVTAPSGDSAREHRMWLGDSSNAFAALLLGRSLAGMRAGDIASAVDLLQARSDLGIKSIRALGVGRASISTLLATAFDKRIASTELERMLTSYWSVIESPVHRGVMEDVIHGAIREFDLPDLVTALGPRVTRVVDNVDALEDVNPARGQR